MVIKNNVFVILVCINILILSAAGFVIAGLYHDINILCYYNDSMRQSLAEVQQEQATIQKDMRQVKNESDIVFRMVVSGEYIKEIEE